MNIPGYTIHKEIGSGGMATVFLATQDSLGRDVALKVMHEMESSHPELDSSSTEYKDRFMHEGQDLAALQHPNIVTIHDISHTGETYYYAMELLKAGSLTDRMVTGVSLVDAFKIIIQIGSALECAHQNNIIHRDLKPSNILFRDKLTPVLTDFGIAKNTKRNTRITKTGALLGTPSYMSPEQCRGLALDGRSDQYSLCILFFEMITGYLPFDATDSIAVAMKQVTEPVPKLPENLAALQPIIDIGMDKDPKRRFSSVAEFCRVLNEILGEDSLQDHMHEVTQKISVEGTSETHLNQQQSWQESSPFIEPSGLDIPTEDEFWGKTRARPWLVVLFFFATVGFAGHYYYHEFWLKQQQPISESDRFVPVLMRKAERQVALSQLLEPTGNNAHETLMKIIELEPNHQPAIQMLDDVATTFEIEARDYLAKKEFDKVKTQLEKGFRFSPSHKGLLSVQQLLDDELNKLETQKTVKKKLAKIEQLYKRKQYIRPANENALQEVKRVLSLDPENLTALGYREKIQTIIENDINNKFKRNKLSSIKKDIEQLITLLPTSTKLRDIKFKIAESEKQKSLQNEVSGLLAQAESHFTNGRYVQPDRDNALSSYKKVLQLQPTNKTATKRLTAIAALMESEAREKISKKNYSQALLSIDNGLRAIPHQTALLQLKKTVSDKIIEQNNSTEQTFIIATQAIDKGNIVFPENNNAHSALRKILIDHPNHKAARQLINSLPSRLIEQINHEISNQNFDLVDQLYSLGLKSFPKNKPLIELERQILDSKVNYQSLQQLSKQQSELNKIINLKSVSISELTKAAELVNSLAQHSESEATVVESFSFISENLEQLIPSTKSLEEIDLILKVIDLATKISFADSSSIAKSQSEITQLAGQAIVKRKMLTQLELDRLEKLKVELRINARPWGKVARVIGSDGKEVILGEQRHTPITLKLLPGNYQILLTNPSYKHRSLDVKVAQDTSTEEVVFDTITAENFFKKVDY
ncbi:MAG: protein kinase [Kangiellaceae bacterium]|nr:protein kinase [Kangiellaceae bacterium]